MKKVNNKGFSIVELIIVITIMSVLVVVLAPQYVKQVEKSRNSADVTNASEIATALQMYASDPDAAEGVPASGDMTITITGNAAASIGTTHENFVKAALKEAGLADASGNLSTRCVSRTNWANYTITASPDGSGGLQFSYSAGMGATAADDTTSCSTVFSDAMSGVKSTD